MAEKKAIVIFGATGDLALKMIYPSLYFLDSEGQLPPNLTIIGVARSRLSDDQFAAQVHDSLTQHATKDFAESKWPHFAGRLRYCDGDVTGGKIYGQIAEMLEGTSSCLYYLSRSPHFFGTIAGHIKEAGLAHDGARIAIEKPIGHD